jgi:hypothetical protein
VSLAGASDSTDKYFIYIRTVGHLDLQGI